MVKTYWAFLNSILFTLDYLENKVNLISDVKAFSE